MYALLAIKISSSIGLSLRIQGILSQRELLSDGHLGVASEKEKFIHTHTLCLSETIKRNGCVRNKTEQETAVKRKAKTQAFGWKFCSRTGSVAQRLPKLNVLSSFPK